MGSGKVLAGVLAGVAIGTAIGILIAPDKGSETRKKIASKRGELTGALGDKFNEFIDKVTKQFEQLKDEAANAAESATEGEGGEQESPGAASYRSS